MQFARYVEFWLLNFTVELRAVVEFGGLLLDVPTTLSPGVAFV